MAEQECPRKRAARYRELAGEALTSAADCRDEEAHAAYLKLAYGWNAMAAEVEFLLR